MVSSEVDARYAHPRAAVKRGTAEAAPGSDEVVHGPDREDVVDDEEPPVHAALADADLLLGPRTRACARCSAGGGGGSGSEQLLGDPLDLGGLDAAFVGLHDVADEAARLLRVADREGLETLADEDAEGRVVERGRQEALAERDLDAEAGGLVRAPLPDLLELAQRLLELPSVGADDVEDQRVVDLAGEPLAVRRSRTFVLSIRTTSAVWRSLPLMACLRMSSRSCARPMAPPLLAAARGAGAQRPRNNRSPARLPQAR
jgi:hypothetical protein